MKKITTNTKTLSNAVANANNYTAKDGDYKGSIVLVGNNGKLEVKATDAMQTIILKNIDFISSDLTDPNFEAISLDGKKLATVLKVIKSEEVIIEINSGYVTIKSNRSRVKIETHAKSQEIEIERGYGNKLDLAGCIDKMDSLFHAIDMNNPKWELNGLLIQVEDKKINMVATDTKRLGVVSKEANIDDLDIIVPKQAVSTIVKLFSVADVEAEADDTMFTINTLDKSYSTKLINGKFPDYKRIVPTRFSHEITIVAKSLVEVVEEAAMFENDIMISVKNQILSASDLSKNTEVFAAEDEIIDKDADITFAVNAKYILEFVSSISSETIELCFNDHNVPFVLKAEDYQEIIMPIILEDESKNENAA